MIIDRVTYQSSRAESFQLVSPLVSTVIELDIRIEEPKERVTPIVLCAQSKRRPVEVLKKVSTENEKPLPNGGTSTVRETISQ